MGLGIKDIVYYFSARKYDRRDMVATMENLFTPEELEVAEHEYFQNIQRILLSSVDHIKGEIMTANEITQILIYRELMLMEEYETLEKLKSHFTFDKDRLKKVNKMVTEFLKLESL